MTCTLIQDIILNKVNIKIAFICASCLAALHLMPIFQPHACPNSGSDRDGLSVQLIKASRGNSEVKWTATDYKARSGPHAFGFTGVYQHPGDTTSARHHD